MPTLRQLNVHPQTQERLSLGGNNGGIIKRKHQSSTVETTNTNTNTNTNNNTSNEKKRKSSSWSPPPPRSSSSKPSSSTTSSSVFIPIRTPSALLSRDPIQLSSSLSTSLATIKHIRGNTANSIIHIGHGIQAEEIIDGVTKYCCCSRNNDNDDNNDDTNDAKGRDNMMVRRRPKALIAGAVTVLDLCARTLLLKSSKCSSSSSSSSSPQSSHSVILDCIRTGSTSIDQLLALTDDNNNTYSSLFDNGWSMPYPYNIPSCSSTTNNNHDIYHDDVNNNNNNINNNIYSGHGIPYGMVTELSGPPSSGKTQLSLSITTHAVLENQLHVYYISGGNNSRKALSRRLFTLFVEQLAAKAKRSSSLLLRDDAQPQQQQQMEENAKSMALKALDRVTIASVSDAYSLLAMLAQIDHEETSIRRRRGGSNNNKKVGSENNNNNNNNGTLLVVDSVSACLGHHLSSDMGPSLANQVALTLRHLARSHDGHYMNTISSKGGGNNNNDAVIKPRRFAVVITNGSVAKFSLDKKDQPSLIGSSSNVVTSAGGNSKTPSQNKPAMGRYWHVSDIGIWLEEDTKSSNGATSRAQQQPINFYNDTSVVGLALGEKKVICATLQNHYGKSCKKSRDNNAATGQQTEKLYAKFRIRNGGIDDV